MHKVYNIKNELEFTINAPWDAIVIMDRSGLVIYVSSTVENFSQIKKEDILGKKFFDFFKMGKASNSAALSILQKKQSVSMLQKVYIGKERDIFINSMPIFDKYGELERVVLTYLDMTEDNQSNEGCNFYKQFVAQHYMKLKKHQTIKEKFIYKSDEMKKIFHLVNRVSQVDSNILLEGESGVGKEVIASFIHKMSPRNKHPFICINCSAIPEQLLEAELFGYEEGAFTGAKKDGKKGLIELAHNGTLFLDEINSLHHSLQAKLLRVLESKELSPIGSTEVKKVNFRLISAANKNLKKLVEKELFREDLFYRLNVIPIYIPPLRKRKEDITALTMHFLKYFNNQYKFKKKLSFKALKYIEGYSWPGNVRELKNVIERIIVVTSNYLITVKDLPPEIAKNEEVTRQLKSKIYKDIDEKSDRQLKPQIYKKVDKKFEIIIKDIVPLEKILNETEKLLIKKSIDEFGSSREIADAISISQSSAARKIRKFLNDPFY